MRFDRLSLLLLVMMAAARCFPQLVAVTSVVAVAFLARLTVAMSQAAALHGRTVPVAASHPDEVITLHASDLA
jgi:hypothetical protein